MTPSLEQIRPHNLNKLTRGQQDNKHAKYISHLVSLHCFYEIEYFNF